MKTRIIRIGNSQGVRIPKPLLQQSGLRDEVELEVHDGKIVLRSAEDPRSGWAEAFRSMAEHEDDALLDSNAVGTTEWDDNEWQW